MSVEFVSITNNRPSLIHLPDSVATQTITDPETNEKTKRTIATPTATLMPGRNNVRKDVWERVRKNPQVKSWLGEAVDDYGERIEVLAPNGRPWIEESGDVSAPEGVQPPRDLSRYTTTQSVALIDATDNLDVLKRWEQHDGRSEIKNAIARRIAALTGTQTPAQQNARKAQR